MRDDLLREVLSSPLDDGPPGRRGFGAPIAVFLAASLVTVGVIAGIAALGSDGETAAATTTTEAVTTTTAPPEAPIGLEVQWEYQLGDRVLIVVAATTAPGQDPREADRMDSANWVLRVDEQRTVSATAEHSDHGAPGIFTLTFPRVERAGATTLLAYPLEDRAESAHEVPIGAAAFPYTEPMTPITIGDEILEIDLRIDDGGGTLVWALTGDTRSRATVAVQIDYREAGDGGDSPQRIASEQSVAVPFLSAGLTYGDPARQGTLRLYHLDDPEEPTFRTRHWGDPERAVSVEDLLVVLTVRLHGYADDPIEIPFDPAAPLTAGG